MRFTMDFETGDLQGWEKAGNAFDNQPTLDDNLTARGRREPSNHQGRYWIGTHENFQGRPGQSPGDIQGDDPQGTLTCLPFTIPSGTLSFLIGGGDKFETRVELVIVDDAEQHEGSIYYETGKNIETMERVTWDLNPYAGRTGRIRIVDEYSGEWGHINVDDFRLEANVEVPDVVGHDLSDAKRIITEAKLELGQVAEVDSDVESETVVRQNPVAGTEVAVGTAVDLYVAARKMVEVPDLRGHSRQEAEEILKETRLRLGEIIKRFSDQEESTILWQDPVAGAEVPVGTDVELWVAVTTPVKVPDLRGHNLKEAEKILQEARLRLGEVVKRLSRQEEGTILRQDPVAGTRAFIGTAVDLWVAVTVPVKVPDLTGHSLDEAKEILKEVRLHLGEVTKRFSDQESGTILGQNPTAGTRVLIGAAVDLHVAARETTDVPDLRGHGLDEGREILKEARLRIGDVFERESSQEENIIVLQDPVAGTRIPIGGAVNLWVTVRALVKVPDLLGHNREQAKEILKEFRLRLGEVTECSSDQENGTTLRQNPLAGTRVPVGTDVKLWVAGKSEKPITIWVGIIGGALIILGGGYCLFYPFRTCLRNQSSSKQPAT